MLLEPASVFTTPQRLWFWPLEFGRCKLSLLSSSRPTPPHSEGEQRRVTNSLRGIVTLVIDAGPLGWLLCVPFPFSLPAPPRPHPAFKGTFTL